VEDLRDRLKMTPLFVRLNDEEMGQVLSVAREERYEAGGVIVQEGDPGDSLYLILEGAVEVVKQGPTGAVTLMTLHRDDCFGEMSLLDIENRSASAVAAEPTRVLRFRAEDLAGVFRANDQVLPLLVTNIARILSRRLRAADEKIVAFSAGRREDSSS